MGVMHQHHNEITDNGHYHLFIENITISSKEKQPNKTQDATIKKNLPRVMPSTGKGSFP